METFSLNRRMGSVALAKVIYMVVRAIATVGRSVGFATNNCLAKEMPPALKAACRVRRSSSIWKPLGKGRQRGASSTPGQMALVKGPTTLQMYCTSVSGTVLNSYNRLPVASSRAIMATAHMSAA